MQTELQLDIRPRTTGEVLDDAIRLGLADAPLLLALSGLFLVPATVALFFLLALPAEGHPWPAFVPPILVALLLPLTGLGSGACQELFRRRAEDIPVSLRGCLSAAGRRGLDHVAARALLLGGGLLGLALLVLPGLAIWMALATVHPWLVAGDRRLGAAVRESARALQRNGAKVVASSFARLALAAFLILNLHELLVLGLAAAGNLAGLDVALLALQFTLFNPAYFAVLVLLACWLLAPFAEACNYLLHVDTRVRYEGLDLWYRVQRHFPLTARGGTGAAVVTLAFVFGFTAPLHAADGHSDAVRAARQEVGRITGEVRRAAPYPGGARWQRQLQAVGDRLKRAGDVPKNRYRWFDEAVEEFGRRERVDAVRVLDQIDARLALLEDSLAAKERMDPSNSALRPDDARKLLPDKAPPVDETKKPRDEPPRKKAEALEVETKGGRGGEIMAPAASGFSALGWMVLVGLFVACVVVAAMLYLQHRRQMPKIDPKRKSGPAAPGAEISLDQPDHIAPAALWKQADDLAQQGQFLEAVRRLYLAVLSLLHRERYIYYEKTRTNGEYLRQARRAPAAPAGLHAPFGQLTRVFDQKWYGDRVCDEREYHDCRALAEQLREEVGA